MYTAQQICESLGSDIIRTFGNMSASVNAFGTLDALKSETVVFIKNEQKAQNAKAPEKSIIILPEGIFPELEQRIQSAQSLGIVVKNPRLSFVRIISRYFAPQRATGIHPTAIIDPSAHIGHGCYIGPYTVVGPNCKIGDNSTLHAHIHLYDNIEIGKNCIVHSGTVIGTDGFGFQKNEDNTYEKFHHFGKVIIGDNVEIGGQTCIDRGTLGDTIIGNGSKIDNLVHISHNVNIGEHCTIIANAMVGGSAKIGAHSWVGPSASIINQAEIGKNVLVGVAANVIRNVADNTVVAGNPAKPIIKKTEEKA